MKRVIKSRPPLERFQKIAARLASGKHFTGQALADELEVSRKTVERDIQFMRDRLELPIETDGSSFVEGSGFYFKAPVRLCPVCCHSTK